MGLKSIKDEDFDALYPIKIKKLSGTHWTPVDVCKKAIGFLAETSEDAVLDLGSGVGKFCIIAAACSDAQITGVEQRGNLIRISRKIASKYPLERLDFIHDDLANIDFGKYQGFYFFNSFEDNISFQSNIGDLNYFISVTYRYYVKLLHHRFGEAVKGTGIVTYCGNAAEIPESYSMVRSSNNGKLKFWQKME